MNRRRCLILTGSSATLLTGCLDSGGGSADESDTENGESEFAVVYNFQRYDRLTTPDNPDVYYESDDEDQYIGVQIVVTNQADEEFTLGDFELSILADGGLEGVSMHARSKTEPLDAIGAGETVETWLFYLVPPGVEDLEFAPTERAEHSFDLTHDEGLEIELTEYEG